MHLISSYGNLKISTIFNKQIESVWLTRLADLEVFFTVLNHLLSVSNTFPGKLTKHISKNNWLKLQFLCYLVINKVRCGDVTVNMFL